MTALLRIGLGAVLVLSLAAPALAEDTIILADGTIRKGEVLEVLDDAVRIRITPKNGGSATLRLPASDLDPHYFYTLAAEKAGDDAKAHLRLALWAFDAGLFSRAKIQVERAAELDPTLVEEIRTGKLPEIREKIAAKVLESSQRDIENKRYDLAEKKLQTLLARMPDTEAGTAAVKVYDDLQVTIEEHQAREEKERMEKLAEEERRKEEELQRRVEPIRKDLKRSDELLDQALTEDNEGKALKLLHEGIAKGNEALKRIAKVRKDYEDDADLQARADEVTKQTVAALVNAHVRAADIYLWRGSTKQAREELAEARKLDPENPEIHAAEVRADEVEDQGSLDVFWQRNRREGHRFRSGTVARGGRRR